MTVRLLAGAAMGAALAGFAAGALSLREPEPEPAAPVASVAEAPPVELPPAPAVERVPVPAGILARAANARALERGPSCPQPDAEPVRCVPDQREAIEIEWHVAPRDP